MSIEIVYGPPTDSPVCGIMWKTCTKERWDPNRPYDVVAKGFHMWPIRERAYIVLIRPTRLVIDSDLHDILGYD
jgi:hypothetical protein